VAGPVARLRCELRSFAKIHDGAACTQWHGKLLDASDSALVQIDFADGALGIVQATRWATGHANHLRVEVHGTLGALWFDLDESYERLHLCVGRDVHRAAWRTRELKPGADIWQRFCRAIRTGRAAQPDIARGAQAQALLAACVQSAATGRWEAIPDLLPAPRLPHA
jgi:predicted dehydrogenase